MIQEGLSLLREESHPVILLDLSLPDGHGLDTIRQVCAVAPYLPVVILTGPDDETIAIRAVQEGAEDYLVKGQMDGNLLARAIRYAIEFFSCELYKFLSKVPARSFFCCSLLVFLRSRASARTGKSKEPPGREKIATVGMIFAMFLRWILISFFSSRVHSSSVFLVFIRSCISPLTERISIRMASLFTTISLLRYLLIIDLSSQTSIFLANPADGTHPAF